MIGEEEELFAGAMTLWLLPEKVGLEDVARVMSR